MALLFLLLAAGAAGAESIVYEIYELAGDGKRRLLAQGTKHYAVQDIHVDQAWVGETFWQKSLAVAQGFVVGASVHRDTSLSGFGLWLRRPPAWYEIWSDGGFSWDWFTRVEGPIYRKLQGPGRVKATVVTGPGYEELAMVEFLEDATLRLKDRPWFLSFLSDGDTHHMVVRKGSVLRLAP